MVLTDGQLAVSHTPLITTNNIITSTEQSSVVKIKKYFKHNTRELTGVVYEADRWAQQPFQFLSYRPYRPS